MKNSKIEWCHHTVNFWWGCTFARLMDGSIDECCLNCYAFLLSKLFSRGKATWGPNGNRWIRHEAARRELYKMDKEAHRRGVRERVFINSMSDTFEERDDLNEARGFLWDACNNVTNLDMLLLTKRPQNVLKMVPPSWQTAWPANVWIGTTCGSQQSADERIPELLKIPAAVRFLSCEPLLGPIDLLIDGECSSWHCPECGSVNVDPDQNSEDGKFWTCPHCMQSGEGEADWKSGIHWVICGGESGHGARPMHPDWARALRDQCQAAGVPFFFKQWGEWHPAIERESDVTIKIGRLPGEALAPVPADPRQHRFADGRLMLRVTKAVAGRMLDRKEHSEFPSQ